MRVIALVFAFALCAGAFAAFTPNRKMSNVLAQVQSLLQTGGPASNVFNLLDSISDDVRKEQTAHDTLHATHQTQCDEELSFRNAQVAEAEDALTRSANQQSRCETSLTRAEASLEENLRVQDETEQAIATKDRIRREEAALFAVRVQQRDDAVEAIQEGLRIVDDLYLGQASLLQVSQHAANMIKKAVSMRQTAIFAPAVTALAQFASQVSAVNGEAVDRVRQLLLEVEDQVQNAFNAYQDAENSAIQHYTETREALVNQLNDLVDEEGTLRAHTAQMRDCIVEETAVQADATQKRARNSQLLDDATALCNSYYQQYETATAAREDELKVIAQLRIIVQQRFGQLKGSAANRADQDAFDAYENRSEFEGDAYTKQGGNYNEAGANQAGYNRDHELERLI